MPRPAATARFAGLELSASSPSSSPGGGTRAHVELIARRGWDGLAAETVWPMPTIFIGGAAQIRDDFLERRERFGLSYLVTSDHDLPAVAEIIGAP